jgi:hypothetical protein
VLKHYIFWGIFTLVLMGIGVSAMRQKVRRQRCQEAKAESGSMVVSDFSPEALPVAIPPAAAFDPNATRIHFRAPPTGMSPASMKRDEAILPIEASARLVCVGGTQKGNSFSVAVAGIMVGRDPGNDVVIDDPRVSSRHAWVGIVDRRAVLRDLGSTNGTFLNARIESPVSEAVLSPGDTIFFGGHGGEQFLFAVD